MDMFDLYHPIATSMVVYAVLMYDIDSHNHPGVGIRPVYAIVIACNLDGRSLSR